MVSRHISANASRTIPRRHDSPEVLPSATAHAGSLSAKDREAVMARLQMISRMFDDAVRVPGTKITFGWDAVLGLIPVIGDAATTVVASYFLWEANRLGASRWTMTKMLGNVAVDFVIGIVPLVGDLADIGFRANRRNLKLLEKELNRRPKK